MGETFYSVLGVDADADREAIQAAYREHVKETHPDVSDNPDARQSFKRLTTARDVLVDEAERDRYDRLGHDTYVSKELTDAAWGSERAASTSAAPGATQRAPTQESAASATGWRGRRNDTTQHSSRKQPTGTTTSTGGGQSRTDGGHQTAGWQTASEAYTRSHVDIGDQHDSGLAAAIAGAKQVGPWLFVHTVLIVSAIATTWFTYLATPGVDLPLPALLAVTIMLPLVIALSVLHLMVTVYS